MISFTKILTLPLVMVSMNCSNCYSSESKNFTEFKTDFDKISNIINASQIYKATKTEILRSITKINDKDILKNLYSVLKALPESGITEKILTNISNMNKNTLNSLSSVLRALPEVGKTERILANIVKINDSLILFWIFMILNELPEAGITEKILLNISEINDKNTLKNIDNELSIASTDAQKIEVLRKLRLLTEQK